MYSNLLEDSSQNRAGLSNKDIFDLGLIQKEKLGDILFGIGTILAWISSKQAEANIIQGKTEQPSYQDGATSENDPAKTVALAAWVFLAAIIIFAITSYKKFVEQKSDINASSSPADYKKLAGSEITAFGNIVKVIGFTIVAVGDQITANSSGTNKDSIT